MSDTMADATEDAADNLAELCADLLAEARYEAVLSKLFAAPSGRWLVLAELLNSFGERRSELAALDKAFERPTRVTWLPYPDSAEGPSYATVLFFNEAGMSRIWIYNRGRLTPDLAK